MKLVICCLHVIYYVFEQFCYVYDLLCLLSIIYNALLCICTVLLRIFAYLLCLLFVIYNALLCLCKGLLCIWTYLLCISSFIYSAFIMYIFYYIQWFVISYIHIFQIHKICICKVIYISYNVKYVKWYMNS